MPAATGSEGALGALPPLLPGLHKPLATLQQSLRLMLRRDEQHQLQHIVQLAADCLKQPQRKHVIKAALDKCPGLPTPDQLLQHLLWLEMEHNSDTPAGSRSTAAASVAEPGDVAAAPPHQDVSPQQQAGATAPHAPCIADTACRAGSTTTHAHQQQHGMEQGKQQSSRSNPAKQHEVPVPSPSQVPGAEASTTQLQAGSGDSASAAMPSAGAHAPSTGQQVADPESQGNSAVPPAAATAATTAISPTAAAAAAATEAEATTAAAAAAAASMAAANQDGSAAIGTVAANSDRAAAVVGGEEAALSDSTALMAAILKLAPGEAEAAVFQKASILTRRAAATRRGLVYRPALTSTASAAAGAAAAPTTAAPDGTGGIAQRVCPAAASVSGCDAAGTGALAVAPTATAAAGAAGSVHPMPAPTAPGSGSGPAGSPALVPPSPAAAAPAGNLARPAPGGACGRGSNSSIVGRCSRDGPRPPPRTTSDLLLALGRARLLHHVRQQMKLRSAVAAAAPADAELPIARPPRPLYPRGPTGSAQSQGLNQLSEKQLLRSQLLVKQRQSGGGFRPGMPQLGEQLGRAVKQAGEWRAATGVRKADLVKAVVDWHAEAAAEAKRQREEAMRQRLAALKASDMAAYLDMVRSTANGKVQELLQQTDACLKTLAQKLAKAGAKVDLTAAAEEEQGGDAGANQHMADGILGSSAAWGRLAQQLVASGLDQQPALLKGGQLRDYQMHGLRWMVGLAQHGLNGILADEMGLGKTVQVIALICHLIEQSTAKGAPSSSSSSGPGRYLICCPASVLPNWVAEVKCWAPQLKVVVYKGSAEAREDIYYDQVYGKSFHVLLTTYDYLMSKSDRPRLSRTPWQLLVVDEGHRLKNADCKLSRELKAYRTKSRLLLTGTPLQNKLEELWALLNFLMPDLFNSADDFDAWFGAPLQAIRDASGSSEGPRDSEAALLSQEEYLLVTSRLHQVLRPFVLRRLKDSVAKELPDKREVLLRCPLSPYQQLLTDLVTASLVDEEGEVCKAKGINNTVMELRSICNHPYISRLHPAYAEDVLPAAPRGLPHVVRICGKMLMLDQVLLRLAAGRHKVLLFSTMTRALDVVEEHLAWRGWEYLRLDGGVSAGERGELVERFNNPDSGVFMFLLSIRAGGVGLNLQAADTVIMYDSDWNPQIDLQAQARAHRIGQQREVLVVRLAAQGSIEEHILRVAEEKRKFADSSITGGFFDGKTSQEQRREFLLSILQGAGPASSTSAAGLTHQQLNQLLARGPEEVDLFDSKVAGWAGTPAGDGDGGDGGSGPAATSSGSAGAGASASGTGDGAAGGDAAASGPLAQLLTASDCQPLLDLAAESAAPKPKEDASLFGKGMRGLKLQPSSQAPSSQATAVSAGTGAASSQQVSKQGGGRAAGAKRELRSTAASAGKAARSRSLTPAAAVAAAAAEAATETAEAQVERQLERGSEDAATARAAPTGNHINGAGPSGAAAPAASAAGARVASPEQQGVAQEGDQAAAAAAEPNSYLEDTAESPVPKASAKSVVLAAALSPPPAAAAAAASVSAAEAGCAFEAAAAADTGAAGASDGAAAAGCDGQLEGGAAAAGTPGAQGHAGTAEAPACSSQQQQQRSAAADVEHHQPSSSRPVDVATVAPCAPASCCSSPPCTPAAVNAEATCAAAVHTAIDKPPAATAAAGATLRSPEAAPAAVSDAAPAQLAEDAPLSAPPPPAAAAVQGLLAAELQTAPPAAGYSPPKQLKCKRGRPPGTSKTERPHKQPRRSDRTAAAAAEVEQEPPEGPQEELPTQQQQLSPQDNTWEVGSEAHTGRSVVKQQQQQQQEQRVAYGPAALGTAAAAASPPPAGGAASRARAGKQLAPAGGAASRARAGKQLAPAGGAASRARAGRQRRAAMGPAPQAAADTPDGIPVAPAAATGSASPWGAAVAAGAVAPAAVDSSFQAAVVNETPADQTQYSPSSPAAPAGRPQQPKQQHGGHTVGSAVGATPSSQLPQEQASAAGNNLQQLQDADPEAAAATPAAPGRGQAAGSPEPAAAAAGGAVSRATGRRGVYWRPGRKRWVVEYVSGGKLQYGGSYKTQAAAEERLAACLELVGAAAEVQAPPQQQPLATAAAPAPAAAAPAVTEGSEQQQLEQTGVDMQAHEMVEDAAAAATATAAAAVAAKAAPAGQDVAWSQQLLVVKGIHWRADRRKWVVRFEWGGARYYEGCFAGLEEAQAALEGCLAKHSIPARAAHQAEQSSPARAAHQAEHMSANVHLAAPPAADAGMEAGVLGTGGQSPLCGAAAQAACAGGGAPLVTTRPSHPAASAAQAATGPSGVPHSSSPGAATSATPAKEGSPQQLPELGDPHAPPPPPPQQQQQGGLPRDMCTAAQQQHQGQQLPVVKGIHWTADRRKWVVRFEWGGARYYEGCFAGLEEAQAALEGCLAKHSIPARAAHQVEQAAAPQAAAAAAAAAADAASPAAAMSPPPAADAAGRSEQAMSPPPPPPPAAAASKAAATGTGQASACPVQAAAVIGRPVVGVAAAEVPPVCQWLRGTDLGVPFSTQAASQPLLVKPAAAAAGGSGAASPPHEHTNAPTYSPAETAAAAGILMLGGLSWSSMEAAGGIQAEAAPPPSAAAAAGPSAEGSDHAGHVPCQQAAEGQHAGLFVRGGSNAQLSPAAAPGAGPAALCEGGRVAVGAAAVVAAATAGLHAAAAAHDQAAEVAGDAAAPAAAAAAAAAGGTVVASQEGAVQAAEAAAEAAEEEQRGTDDQALAPSLVRMRPQRTGAGGVSHDGVQLAHQQHAAVPPHRKSLKRQAGNGLRQQQQQRQEEEGVREEELEQQPDEGLGQQQQQEEASKQDQHGDDTTTTTSSSSSDEEEDDSDSSYEIAANKRPTGGKRAGSRGNPGPASKRHKAAIPPTAVAAAAGGAGRGWGGPARPAAMPPGLHPTAAAAAHHQLYQQRLAAAAAAAAMAAAGRYPLPAAAGAVGATGPPYLGPGMVPGGGWPFVPGAGVSLPLGGAPGVRPVAAGGAGPYPTAALQAAWRQGAAAAAQLRAFQAAQAAAAAASAAGGGGGEDRAAGGVGLCNVSVPMASGQQGTVSRAGAVVAGEEPGVAAATAATVVASAAAGRHAGPAAAAAAAGVAGVHGSAPGTAGSQAAAAAAIAGALLSRHSATGGAVGNGPGAEVLPAAPPLVAPGWGSFALPGLPAVQALFRGQGVPPGRPHK